MRNQIRKVISRFPILERVDSAILGRITIFVLLCQVMAIMIAVFIWSGDRNVPFVNLLMQTEISTMSIAPLVFIVANYVVAYVLPRLTRGPRFFIFVGSNLLATLVGFCICYALAALLLEGEPARQFNIALPIIGITAPTITVAMSIVGFVIHLSEEKMHQAYSDRPLPKQAEPPSESIMLRAEDGHRRVALRDIIYLSAHGEKTVVHTPSEDIVIAQYLSKLAEQSSDAVIRCHRSFAFNLDWCVRIVGAAGGRYTVFLRDDDETNLPVGRSYATAVKEKLGMSKLGAPAESEPSADTTDFD